MKKPALIAFWLLSLTWGLPAALAGAVLAALCLAKGLKPKLFRGNIYFEHVRPRGSNNLGPFFFLGDNAIEFTPYHEAGHGLQNILYGPLFFLVVGVPSELWYGHFNRKYAKEISSGSWSDGERWAAYEKMPVERQASSWGAKVYGWKKQE
ncbi:MAG: hypothetical protein LBT21_06530 [Oscillospiraceae bacterium]|jgi:hypothetical protein|nr:hypothetical protein [Oscillospiraceae bacterium]